MVYYETDDDVGAWGEYKDMCQEIESGSYGLWVCSCLCLSNARKQSEYKFIPGDGSENVWFWKFYRQVICHPISDFQVLFNLYKFTKDFHFFSSEDLPFGFGFAVERGCRCGSRKWIMSCCMLQEYETHKTYWEFKSQWKDNSITIFEVGWNGIWFVRVVTLLQVDWLSRIWAEQISCFLAFTLLRQECTKYSLLLFHLTIWLTENTNSYILWLEFRMKRNFNVNALYREWMFLIHYFLSVDV